jgi:hypothetical protein
LTNTSSEGETGHHLGLRGRDEDSQRLRGETSHGFLEARPRALVFAPDGCARCGRECIEVREHLRYGVDEELPTTERIPTRHAIVVDVAAQERELELHAQARDLDGGRHRVHQDVAQACSRALDLVLGRRLLLLRRLVLEHEALRRLGTRLEASARVELLRRPAFLVRGERLPGGGNVETAWTPRVDERENTERTVLARERLRRGVRTDVPHEVVQLGAEDLVKLEGAVDNRHHAQPLRQDVLERIDVVGAHVRFLRLGDR